MIRASELDRSARPRPGPRGGREEGDAWCPRRDVSLRSPFPQRLPTSHQKHQKGACAVESLIPAHAPSRGRRGPDLEADSARSVTRGARCSAEAAEARAARSRPRGLTTSGRGTLSRCPCPSSCPCPCPSSCPSSCRRRRRRRRLTGHRLPPAGGVSPSSPRTCDRSSRSSCPASCGAPPPCARASRASPLAELQPPPSSARVRTSAWPCRSRDATPCTPCSSAEPPPLPPARQCQEPGPSRARELDAGFRLGPGSGAWDPRRDVAGQAPAPTDGRC